jgi:hypothetical protein
MPYSFIANYLKDKGIILSTQSIMRHNKNHRLSDKKPRQIQKKGIIKSINKARQAKEPTESDIRFIKKGHQFASREDFPPVCPEPSFEARSNKEQKELSYAKELDKMTQDIDVIKEYMEVLAIAKDRVKRGLHEETDSGLVLATTGNAIKDYGQALKNFHEITSGMESITKLRFAQLVQLIGNVFVQTTISDQTRAELLKLITPLAAKATPIRDSGDVADIGGDKEVDSDNGKVAEPEEELILGEIGETTTELRNLKHEPDM